MKSNLLIHHNNVAYATDFTHQLLFKLPHGDIDKYITEIIIPQIKEIDFDVLYIKDSLSLNNLDFYGLRVAYHVRLSPELGEKKYIPIVILSELDGQVIRKITSMAKIIFTDNLFLEKNNKSVLPKFRNLDIKSLDKKMFVDGFLKQIDISAPQDYLSHHAITNEWAIEKWSNALQTHTKAIESNRNHISSMLYFKYLKSLHAENIFGDESYNVKKLQNTGKILYIDDEWSKGWSDVLKTLFSNSEKVEFNTFEYEYKDKNKFKIIGDIKAKILNSLPDVVLLDLRLSKSDHYGKNDLTQYTGMKIVEVIKEINPGIQVIMLTATSQSVILEKLYNAGVLGYVKKEHPEDLSIQTTENIDKLFDLVERGLERKYLKNIFTTKRNIENILKNDIFAQYIADKEKYENFWIQLEVETSQIFDILNNSNSQNKFKYAMVSIASSLETILSIFIVEIRGIDNRYWDGELCKVNTLNTKLNELFYDKFGYEQIDSYRSKLKMKNMIDKRNKYLHSRGEISISKDEIVSWFNKLMKMLEIIKKPPNLRVYNSGNMVEDLSKVFKNR